MTVYHIDLGRTLYKDVWDLQRDVNLYKQKNTCTDLIITTEHEHVYTLGRSGDKNHLLLDDEELADKNISYFEIDRGGDLTYHGPGQLVVYPVIDLSNYEKDSHKYLRNLEEVIILTLKEYGIDSKQDEEYTGVWVGDSKICAIGIKISRWITMHGLAFNVNNDLSHFGKIIPCGIFHKGVTNMKSVLGSDVDLKEVSSRILRNFEKIFDIKIREIDIAELVSEYKLTNHEFLYSKYEREHKIT